MKRNKYISFILLSGLLVACTETDDRISDNTAHTLQIKSVQMERVKTRSTTLLATDGASIGVATLVGGVIDQQNQYTYMPGKAWVSAGSTELIVPAGTAICAYYPYNAAITNKQAIPLTPGLYIAGNDLSYANAYAENNSTNSTTYANLLLQHAYARLTFDFSALPAYTGSKSISNITVTSPEISSSATLDITISPGVYTRTLGTVSVNPAISDFTVTPTCSMLMVPTNSLSNNVNVYIQLGDVVRLLSIPASSFPNGIMDAGTEYRFSVNVTATELSISSVQTTDWVTSAPENKNIICQPEANCYFAYPAGDPINIPVSRANTAALAKGQTLPLQLGVTNFTVGVLWYDANSIQSIIADVPNGVIKVTPSGYTGNVVIFAKANGVIIWTWHIWTSNYEPNIPAGGTTYTANGFTWMDRPVGARNSPGSSYLYCGGTMYQWGRKDPFTGSDGSALGDLAIAKPMSGNSYPSSINGISLTSIARDSYTKAFNVGAFPSITPDQAYNYSITTPFLYLFNWAGSAATTAADGTANGGIYSWDSPTHKKTIYDPCPPGWRVPGYIGGTTSPWSTWTTTASFTATNMSYGTWNAVGTKFPATGCRVYNTGAFTYVGYRGYYWSATPSGSGAYALSFDNASNVTPSVTYSRDYAFPVYCVKEY